MLDRAFNHLRKIVGVEDRNLDANGLLLSGGGARASYQSGVLQFIGERFPAASFPILAGYSAGAINTAHLGNHQGDFRSAATHLIDCWNDISPEDIFESESSFAWFTGKFWRKSDTLDDSSAGKAFVDTSPLRDYLLRHLETDDGKLIGVRRNIDAHRLAAIAMITTNYATGQTVTWVDGAAIAKWERPTRIGVNTTLTVDHILASTALPFIFPAIKIGDAWYGDGGVRLSAPIAPVIHLGARRVLVVSTRYQRTRAEADDPAFSGYPPATQVFGHLMNAIFLDALDQDALMMDRLNALLRQLPARKRMGLRPVKLLVIRPSVDLGKLAVEYETTVTGPLRLLAKGFGSGQSKSPDWLSMLLFDGRYIRRLMEIGYRDAADRYDDIARFLDSES